MKCKNGTGSAMLAELCTTCEIWFDPHVKMRLSQRRQMTQRNSWHIKIWVFSFVFIAHRPLRDKITLAIEAETKKHIQNDYFSPFLPVIIKYHISFYPRKF